MKKIKTLIALFCAVACLLASSFVPSASTTVYAAEYPQELKEIYPSDFGIDDGTYSNYNTFTNVYKGDSLINTLFTMDLKISGSDLWVNYGGNGMWTGMIFKISEDTIVLQDSGISLLKAEYKFTSAVAGTKFKNNTFRFQISIELCDADKDSYEDDFRIGVYFNHALYNNTYIYAYDAKSALGNILYFLPNPLAEKDSTLYEVSSPKNTNAADFYSLSPLDFGFLDGSYDGDEANIDVDINAKSLSTGISFDQKGEYIDYAGIKLESNGYGEIIVSDSTGNQRFDTDRIYSDISDLKVISYKDFGLSSGVESVGAMGNYTGDTLANTYFSAKFKFKQNGYVPVFCYGGGDDHGWAGLQIKFTDTEITVIDTLTNVVGYKIYPTDINCNLTSFSASNGWSMGIDIGISIRYGDYDYDGYRDDVQYGIYVMGKLLGNRFAYVTDYADTEENTTVAKMGTKCRIYCPGGTVTDTTTGVETLVVASVELSDAMSYPVLDSENFDLKISTRAVNGDLDSNKDDLEVKIHINNALLKEFVIVDYNDSPVKLKINADIVNPKRSVSYKDEVLSFSDLGIEKGEVSSDSGKRALDLFEPKVFSGNAQLNANGELKLGLEYLNKLTFRDFGIADGDYCNTAPALGSCGDSLSGYAFSGKITFNATETFYYGGKSANSGIAFTLSGARLKISDFDGNQIASIARTSTNGAVSAFRGTELLLGVAVSVADTDNDGNADDVKLGVWFNNVFFKLYNITNAAKNLGGYVSATSTMSSNYISLASSEGEFSDADLSNVFTSNSSGKLTEIIFGNGSVSGVINAQLPLNDAFDFDLEFKAACLDSDTLKNDIVITLYIDDKVVSAPKFIKNVDISGIFLVFGCENVVVHNRLPENTLDETVYSLYQGDFVLCAVGDVWVNRENGHRSGEMINTPGEYTIVRTYLGDEYVQKVQLWRTGYINSDNDVNILDFVAAQKYMVGEADATYIRKGADLDFDGSVTAKDIIKVKRILLGIDTVPETAQTDKWSFKEDEMPIVGFFAPRTTYLDPTSQDLTPDLCNDKVYKLISDLGINFLNYIEVQYNELVDGLALESRPCTIKHLELTSKYNMGAVIWLPQIYGNNSKAYIDSIGRFSHYSSFAGVNIVDEPDSSTYYYGNVFQGDELTEASQRYKFMTSYTNLYGYANLFPYVYDMAHTDTEAKALEVYRQYMREFCQKFNPKVLSWDYYVLNSLSYAGYFKNLEIGREVAKEFNIPFWTFMQSGDTIGRKGAAAVTTTTEQMLWNANTMLAYGTKGIQYYTLVQIYGTAYNGSNDSYDLEQSGLISVNGEKTKYYDQALAVNNQVKAVDHVLMNSDSEAILAIGGAQAETGLTETTYGCITSVTASAERGAIIGCFDYRGKQAFYVASNSFEESQTVTLTFDGEHSLNLIADGLDSTALASEYQVNLGKGEAVLIVVD